MNNLRVESFKLKAQRLPIKASIMMKKLIAETAFHHQGDEQFMMELIDALCRSKTDCIKIHILLDIDEYMEQDHPLYETIKSWMFPVKVWEKFIQTIHNADKELLVLCNDCKSIDFALEMGAKGLELHAATTHDPHLLGHLIHKTKKMDTKTFIGIGALPLEEVDDLYRQNLDLVLMFGIQNYPTKPEYMALARQRRLMRLFPKAMFGYADHSEWNHPQNMLLTLMGGLDKSYIEKHVTIRPGDKRADYESAISIEQLNQLRDRLDIAEKAEGKGELVRNLGEAQYGQIGPMRKAMIAARDFRQDQELDLKSVAFRRTSKSSDLLPGMLKNNQYFFTRDIKAGEVITSEMLQIKN